MGGIKTPANPKFDKDFEWIEKLLMVGNYISCYYGYVNRDGVIDGVNHSDYLKSPAAPYKISSPKGDKNIIHRGKTDAMLFRIMKPQYSILDTGQVQFTIEAIGAGNEAMELDIVHKFNYKGIPHMAGFKNPPTFTTDHDSGHQAEVKNIINFIDWEIMISLELRPGKYTGHDLDVSNGYSAIGRKGPDIHLNSAIPAHYDSAGWILMRYYEDHYENQYTQEDDDGTYIHVAYCTLSWIAWYFNCVLNEKSDRRIAKGATKPFIIRCDGATTKGNYTLRIPQENLNLQGPVPIDVLKDFPIPSANPMETIFNYGHRGHIGGQPGHTDTTTTGHINTSDYMTFELGWQEKWKGGIRSVKYDNKNKRGVYFTAQHNRNTMFGEPGRYDSIVHDAGKVGKGKVNEITKSPSLGYPGLSLKGESVIKKELDIGTNPLSVDENGAPTGLGDLSKILICRDTLAAIIDEMGGLASDQDATKGENISNISLQNFWNKIFDIVKRNSGGAFDLEMIVDPDQSSTPNITQLLIVNKNEGFYQKTYPPTFNKGDGSTLSLNLKSSIPKAAQAAVFQDNAAGELKTSAGEYGTKPNSTQQQNIDIKVNETKGAEFSEFPSIYDFLVAKHDMTDASFSAETCDVLRGLIKKALDAAPVIQKLNNWQNLFPLQLELKILGIQGFRFGDLILTGMLPPRYLRRSGSAKIGFTVLKIEHRFDEGGWVTVLHTQCRMIPSKYVDDQNGKLESSLKA